jgi:hypothetical protein
MMKWMRWVWTNKDGSERVSYSNPEEWARFLALYGQPKHEKLRPATRVEIVAEKKRRAEESAYYEKHGRYPS